MTIDFNAIKVHDLVYLDNIDSLDFDNDGEIEGWHIVTGVSQRVGFFTAAPLGDMDHSVYVDDMDIIKNHIRAAAVPGAIEALERIKGKLDSLETDLDGICDDAETALRAVRGEDSNG